MKILLVAPHPDDDVLGCGGSIIHHRKNGHEVTILYMTSGEAGDMRIPKTDLALIREREAREAVEVMGKATCIFLHLPDGYISADEHIFIEVTKHIRHIQPDLVYVPHALDGHRDHKITHDIVTDSIVRAARASYPECGETPWSVSTVLAYEVWTPIGNVSYTEDISDSMDVKISAIQKHSSQLANVSYDQAIRGLNRYRGATTGKGEYCECFQILQANKLSF